MDYGLTKDSQVLPETILNTQDYTDKYGMNYKNCCNSGVYIYIVNMTKAGTNRHEEIHDKTLEEQTLRNT